ncbi:MAG: FMN-binding protein [Calditrichaeota bacterium]|nr:MAG: FMN-binding protein [Calditrichota bacterium]
MNQAELDKLVEAPNSWHMVRALAGIGLMCALLIVTTYELTFETIKQNKAEVLERAIFKVVPGAQSKTTFIVKDGQVEKLQGESNSGLKYYAGYDDSGKLIGVALEAAGQGFQDIVRVLYGFSPDKQAIVGMEVLESKETPGLGDKIEKDETFLKNFEALDVSLNESGDNLKNEIIFVKNGTKANPWELDGITGATISSKAIAAILQASASQNMPFLNQNIENFKQQ